MINISSFKKKYLNSAPQSSQNIWWRTKRKKDKYFWSFIKVFAVPEAAKPLLQNTAAPWASLRHSFQIFHCLLRTTKQNSHEFKNTFPKKPILLCHLFSPYQWEWLIFTHLAGQFSRKNCICKLLWTNKRYLNTKCYFQF